MENFQDEYSVTILDREHQLLLKPKDFKGKYGCMITFEDKKSKTDLRYKLTIEFLGKTDEFTNLFRISRLPEFYLNDKAAEDFLDELAYEVSNSIYPLEIKTRRNGEILSFNNHDEVVSRWNETKKKLQKKYKGELVSKYIKLTDDTLRSEDRFFDKMSKDWFLQLYFAPLYQQYGHNYMVESEIKYPIAGNALPVNYDTKIKLEDLENESSKDMILKIKGNIRDDRCALDIEQELDTPYYAKINAKEKSLKGTCDITYLLDKKTGIVEGYEGCFDTKFTKEKKITVKMFLLEKLEKNAVAEDDLDTNNEAQKGFWAKLFKK